MQKRVKLMGRLRAPDADDLRSAAARDHLRLSPQEAQGLVPHVAAMLSLLDEIDELPALEVELKHAERSPGRTPTRKEDPYNAFTRICRIEGAPDGPLAGRTVGVKDNLAVAGLPVTNASRTASYVPLTDAVVVERILDAGGTIVGKLNLDDYSAAGYGETSYYGPPRNPRNPAHSAGGSSGGSGAAVASGAVDLALGVDEGGSARIPAAFCGCVAMKATHGLVPSYGLTYFDHTLDFICPMAANVRDVATLLEVIAGDDWRDPQWVRGELRVARYAEAEQAGAEGLRIGVIAETIDEELCEPAVLEGVERALDALRDAGASVETVSVPLVPAVPAIMMATLLGGTPQMIRTDGVGYNHLGHLDVDRVHAFAVSRRREARHLPPFLKLLLLTSAYVEEDYFHVPFAKAHNLRLLLRRQIDAALAGADVLVTPTTPATAPRLSEQHMTFDEAMQRLPRASVQWPFTQMLNLTGHPALALPSGANEDGLPTSVQLVAGRLDEVAAFRAAFAIEARVETGLAPVGVAAVGA